MIRLAMCQFFRLLCGCRARWDAPLQGHGPWVFYANHSSHLDAVLLWAMLPGPVRSRCRTVAAADYWERGPVRRWLAKSVFRAVLVERQPRPSRGSPLRRMSECLDRGESLVLFPEGTRGDGGALGPLRPGLWHLSRERPELSLVPVWIENLSRVLPKGEILPVPFLAAATIGEPIRCKPEESRDEFLQRAHAALLELRPHP